MFTRETDEVTVAWQELDRAAEEARLRQRMEARAAQLAAEEYRRSPVGRAAAAFERGDEFLQLQLSQEQVAGSTGQGDSQGHAADLLGRIEATGWRLLHANWVYVPGHHNGRNGAAANGSGASGAGEVVGIYLFRRAGHASANGSTPAAGYAPKHRGVEGGG